MNDLRQRLVAVLDDDLPFIRMVERVLAGDGIAVAPVTTPDAGDACRVIAELEPDLALIDVFLYGNAEGLELIARLRQQAATSALPMIVTSGARREVARNVEFLREHRCGVLLKPFEPDELLARVRGDSSALAGAREAPLNGTAAPGLRFGWLHR